MSEKQWYADMSRDEYEGKHVRAVMDSGAVVEGRLVLWIGDRVVIFRVGSDEGITVLLSKDGSFRLTDGVKSLDLVWDERDWYRIDVKDVRHGDAVVVNGRLCTVDLAWADDYHPQVVTDAPFSMLIDLCLVPFALRCKAKTPTKPGYYRDREGVYWWRPADVSKNPWYSVNWSSTDPPVMSDEAMASRMPLTPVHFESGRAA